MDAYLLATKSTPVYNIIIEIVAAFFILIFIVAVFTATVLAQSVEHVTAEREVAGSIPGEVTEK